MLLAIYKLVTGIIEHTREYKKAWKAKVLEP